MADEKHAAAAQKKAEDTRFEAAKHKAAVEGARTVAEAVSKLADAAVEEVQKVKAVEKGEFVASGVPGGKFKIVSTSGKIFSSSGTVLLNGKQLFTKHWNVEEIIGNLPEDAKAGEIVVWIDPETQRKGTLSL